MWGFMWGGSSPWPQVVDEDENVKFKLEKVNSLSNLLSELMGFSWT